MVNLIKLKNEKELLEKLKNTDYVKNNKQLAYKAHLPQWQNENIEVLTYTEIPDNFIAIMRFKDNLNIFCVDMDNLYTANTIKFEKQTFNIKTPYGAHYYFKVPKELKDEVISLRKGVASTSTYNSKVEAALNNQAICFECFFGAASNRFMFIGNNAYYKPQNSLSTLREITYDDIEYLRTFIEEPLALTDAALGKINYLKPSIAQYAYKIIRSGKIDPFEFNLKINKTRFRGNIQEMHSGMHRNNFLQSVIGYFGSSGFMHSWDDLVILMHIVNQHLAEPYPIDELNNTILHPSKKFKYEYEDESLTKSSVADIDEDAYLHNLPKVFIARNIERKSTNDAYLYVNLQDEDYPIIEKVINSTHRETYEEAWPRLIRQHHQFFKNDKDELINKFDPKKCPIIRVINSPYSNELISKEGKILIIDLGFYRFNKQIAKLLLNPTSKTQEELLNNVKYTPQYEVFTKNLFPDSVVYATFMGSLQFFLKTKSYLNISCFIKDINGSTGKDSVLTPFLKQMICGSPKNEKYRNESENTYKSISSNEPYITSAHTFINDETTPYAFSNLLIINEDGGNISVDKFNRKWQTIVKNARINCKILYSDRKTVENHIFALRYSNGENELINYSDTNTRIYISEAQQYITKSEWEILFKDFGNTAKERGEKSIQKYESNWLEYILFTDWEALGYKGQDVLPASLAGEAFISFEDIEYQLSQEYKDVVKILRFFINPTTRKVNHTHIERLLKMPTHKLYLLAIQLDIIAQPEKYPNDTLNFMLGNDRQYIHRGGQDRLRLTEFNTLLKHIGLEPNKASRQFIRQMFTKGLAQGYNPDLKYRGKE